jgi:cell wall-associated NlpC family hydrolase
MTILQPRQLLLLVFVLPLFVILAACGSAPQRAVVTDPSARQPLASVSAERLIRLSRQQLGTPYRYGGSSPTEGFDCSGLVHYVHARNGLYVPRSTRDQFRGSTAVPLSAIRPGDLLFFRINGDKPGHVGIYIGRGSFIHAPSSGKAVSQTSLNNPYWQSRLIGAGRFI